MTTRTVTVALQAKVGQYTSSMDKAAKSTTAVDDATKDATRSGRQFSGVAVAIGAAAGAVAVRGISQMIGAASDLGETQSKVGVIFGESASKIEEFGDTAAEQIGQSKTVAMNAASTFATFGKSAGLAGDELATFATDFSVLASDLASFYNTTPEDAIEAIGAALRGETEPIRKYGVMLDDATLRQEALSQGLIKTTKEALTPQNKVLAAQAQIYKQTTDAQGDFARTSEGLANQQRILNAQWQDAQAQLGQVFLPIAQSAVGTMTDLLGAFLEMPPATQRSVIQIGLLGTAAAVAIPKILDLAEGTADFLRSMDGGKWRSAAAIGAIGAMAAGATAGASSMAAMRKQTEDAFAAFASEGSTESIRAINAEIEKLRQKQEDWVTADSLWDVLSDGAETAGWAITSGFKQMDDEISDYQAKIAEMRNKHNAIFEEVARNTNLTASEVEKLAEVAGVDLSQGIGSAALELEEYYESGVQGTIASQDLASAQETLTSEFQTAADMADAYRKQLDSLDGGFVDTQEAADAFSESVDAASEALKENGRTLDGSTEKGRANREALRTMRDRVIDHADAVMRQTGSQEKANEVIAKGREALIKQAKRFLGSRTAAEKYVTQLGLIPPDVTTVAEFETTQAKKDLEAWQRAVREVELGQLRSEEQEFAGQRNRSSSGAREPRATGGSIIAGRDYLIGERGPETLRLSRDGLSGTVRASVPASSPAGRSLVIGPGAVQISISGTNLTGRDVQRVVDQGLMDFARELERA